MKIIKRSKNLRVKICKVAFIKTEICAKFQVRQFFFLWKTVHKVHFNISNFWTVRKTEYLKNTYSSGTVVETWTPSNFNLENRINYWWKEVILSLREEKAALKVLAI